MGEYAALTASLTSVEVPPEAGEAPVKLTPQDALDQMLRRMAENEPRKRPPEENPEEEGYEDDGPYYDLDTGELLESRDRKWWHVPDRKIRDLIHDLRAKSTERQRQLKRARSFP